MRMLFSETHIVLEYPDFTNGCEYAETSTFSGIQLDILQNNSRIEPLPESATASILDSIKDEVESWHSKGLELPEMKSRLL